MPHAPVLLAELLNALDLKPLQICVDATFGGGGVTQALLERGAAQVIALDRDPEAIARATHLSQAYPGRVIVAHDRFSRLGSVLDRLSISGVHGVIFDLGVSSTQLESPDRGFSFRLNGPLDMRMDPRSRNQRERSRQYLLGDRDSSDPKGLRPRTAGRSNRPRHHPRSTSSPDYLYSRFNQDHSSNNRPETILHRSRYSNLPSLANLRQQRTRRTRNRLERSGTTLVPRRTTGRHFLSFPRRPNRQEFYATTRASSSAAVAPSS